MTIFLPSNEQIKSIKKKKETIKLLKVNDYLSSSWHGFTTRCHSDDS